MIDRGWLISLSFHHKYEEICNNVKYINMQDGKSLSMYFVACLQTLRFEDAIEAVSAWKLKNDKYGFQFSEEEKLYNDSALGLVKLSIDKLNLASFDSNSYSQSQSIPDKYGHFPELYQYFAYKYTKNSDSFVSEQIEYLKSGETENMDIACFYIAEDNFMDGKYKEAYHWFLQALNNKPTKAIYYGFAAQAVHRCLLVDEYGKAICLINRAILLNKEYYYWHFIKSHIATCMVMLFKNQHWFDVAVNEVNYAREMCPKYATENMAGIKFHIDVNIPNCYEILNKTP